MMNETGKVKVILYCKDNSSREIYCTELERLSVNFYIADNFDELNEMVKTSKYNGILVDVSTIMRASKKDRINFQKLKNIFPVAQLNWNPIDKSIGTLSHGKSSDTGDLESFFNNEILSFKARTIRKDARKKLCLNTIISKESNFTDQVEKTVTLDISRSGCFIYSVSNWIKSEYIWFLFKEIDLKKPIRGKIKRFTPWGKSMCLPGIGVSFEEIDPDQLNQIIDIIDTFIDTNKPLY